MADRPKGYGMTAELQAKKDAKHDPVLEKEARDWLEAVVGEPFPNEDFQEALKDGKYLCKVINKLAPGSVKKVNDSTMAFKMMENIGNFLDACEKYGCIKTDLFQTVDLYEGQNIPLVVTSIHALGRQAQKKGFQGPVLGPKEADTNERVFTTEQLEQGKGVIGLQMGSNKGSSQAGMSFGTQRQIH